MNNLEEGGARFTFRLPALEVRIARSPRSAQPASEALHILLLEHDEALARGLVRVLEQSGHTAIAVKEPNQVAQVWLEHERAGTPFALTIMNLPRPGRRAEQDALASLRALRPGARVIAMSGHSEDDVMVSPQRHGFSARLKKPFIGLELQEALNTAMSSPPRTDSPSLDPK